MSPTDDHVGSRTNRPLGVIAAVALLLGLLATPPAQAQEQPDPPGGVVQVQRIDGGGADPGDVRATAIATCQAIVSTGALADRVLVSRDDAFADALVAAPLAGERGCILYTGAGAQPLDPRVRSEIDRVLPPDGDVVLLGGVNAVGTAVEHELTEAGFDVSRHDGTTRYETAALVAQAVRDANGPSDFTEVVLAYGEAWPDSVTSGAYAAAQGVPIVLTQMHTLHPAADAFLGSGPAVDRTTVVGGDLVVSEEAAAAAPNPQRVAGSNRMGTAVQIATSLWPTAGATGIDFVAVNLEHPDAWTLALAAAPLSAQKGAPQLGVRTDQLPTETSEYLSGISTDGSDRDPTITVMGDDSFISQSVSQQVADGLGGPGVPAACDSQDGDAPTQIPAEATRVGQVSADMDGDGQADQLTTYEIDSQGGVFFVFHVATDGGFATRMILDEASGLADVRPLGTATIGEGRPVAFVVENVGASVQNVAVLGLYDRLDGPCQLGRVTIADHTAPLQFPVGEGNGLQCRDVDADGTDELVARQISQTGQESTYAWDEQAYTWDGQDAFRTVMTDSGTLTHPQDEAQIQSFSTLDCPGVEAP